MAMINAYQQGAGPLDPHEQALIARRARLLGPAYRLFYQRPVHFVRGEGVWLYDSDGRPYLDVYNNVASVGHSHPAVVEALARQAATLNTHTRYLHEGILDYAERLLAECPPAIGHLMMTCTGSEANDLALRIAASHTGGTGIIISQLAYHGVTSAVAALSPSLDPSKPLSPHVRAVPAPDSYLGDPAASGAAFAAAVQAAIDDLQAAGIKPMALIVDTIFSSDGVFADPPGFLAPAVAAIRAAGGLFIADEVQPGFARTGSHFFGFARHGLVPDLITIGKPMGDGHPVAGVLMRPEVVEDFGRSQRYFNTFGGNPVSVAVADAVLSVIKREGLQDNARDTGAYLIAGLRRLMERHELIGDVRGAGLFIGVELVTDRAAKTPAPDHTARLVNALRERRVLISATGPRANVLKIRPPLVFNRDNADFFLATLDQILTAGL